jgi:hypothetical protein
VERGSDFVERSPIPSEREKRHMHSCFCVDGLDLLICVCIDGIVSMGRLRSI